MAKIELTDEMIVKLTCAHESNKEGLCQMESFIKEHGCLDNGLDDINETFEMGYNNALEYVFSVLGIKVCD